MIRITLAALLALMSVTCFADLEQRYHVAEAQKKVEDYRALRRACSITRGEQRRLCFSRLSEATESYIKAKQFLKLYDDAAPLVSQVDIDQ